MGMPTPIPILAAVGKDEVAAAGDSRDPLEEADVLVGDVFARDELSVAD